jgi:hypothetical protein
MSWPGCAGRRWGGAARGRWVLWGARDGQSARDDEDAVNAAFPTSPLFIYTPQAIDRIVNWALQSSHRCFTTFSQVAHLTATGDFINSCTASRHSIARFHWRGHVVTSPKHDAYHKFHFTHTVRTCSSNRCGCRGGTAGSNSQPTRCNPTR